MTYPVDGHRLRPFSVAVLFGGLILWSSLYTTSRQTNILKDSHLAARAALNGPTPYGTPKVDTKEELPDKLQVLEQLYGGLEVAREGLEQARAGLAKEVEQLKDTLGNLRAEAAQLQAAVDAKKSSPAPPAPLQQALSSSDAQSPSPPTNAWLVVGIPTFPRPGHVDYLAQTLASIADQLPQDPEDPLYDKVRVIIMNNFDPKAPSSPGGGDVYQRHETFEAARLRYAAPHPAHRSFSFVSNDHVLPDPGDNVDVKIDTPNFRVRKQTRDLVSLLRLAKGLGQHYLFLEDDMLLCPHGLLVFQYLLRKASAVNPHWLSVRVSYGMNGIFLHDTDVGPFADYLLAHQARRPPDLLVVEWFAGETKESATYKGSRAHVTFRYNLFDHIGSVSSLRSTRQGAFPRCYHDVESALFQVEAFNPAQCGHDDIRPCPPPEKASTPRIDWGLLRPA